MNMRVLIAFIFVIAATTIGIAQTVRDTARQSAPGPVTISMGCECPEVTLEALASGADIVVQGIVTPLKTYLSPDLLEPGIYGETFRRVRELAVDQLEAELRPRPESKPR